MVQVVRFVRYSAITSTLLFQISIFAQGENYVEKTSDEVTFKVAQRQGEFLTVGAYNSAGEMFWWTGMHQDHEKEVLNRLNSLKSSAIDDGKNISFPPAGTLDQPIAIKPKDAPIPQTFIASQNRYENAISNLKFAERNVLSVDAQLNALGQRLATLALKDYFSGDTSPEVIVHFATAINQFQALQKLNMNTIEMNEFSKDSPIDVRAVRFEQLIDERGRPYISMRAYSRELLREYPPKEIGDEAVGRWLQGRLNSEETARKSAEGLYKFDNNFPISGVGIDSSKSRAAYTRIASGRIAKQTYESNRLDRISKALNDFLGQVKSLEHDIELIESEINCK